MDGHRSDQLGPSTLETTRLITKLVNDHALLMLFVQENPRVVTTGWNCNLFQLIPHEHFSLKNKVLKIMACYCM